MNLKKLLHRLIRDDLYRAIVFLTGTVCIDSVFFIYSILCLTHDVNSRVWYLGLSGWYATLIITRLIILFSFSHGNEAYIKKSVKNIDTVTGFFLIIMAVQTFSISCEVYISNMPENFSTGFVIANGLYVIIKLIYAVVNKNRMKKKTNISAYVMSGQYLSVAENLFLFTLIFYKLIDTFHWHDGNFLLIMAFAEGCIITLITVGMGLNILIKAKRLKI